jgi:hypothetical protein
MFSESKGNLFPRQRAHPSNRSYDLTYRICRVVAVTVLASLSSPAWAQFSLTTVPIDKDGVVRAKF